MTDPINSKQNTTLIAIDIAKFAHDVLIQWPTGKRQLMKIKNTIDDYQRLLQTAGNDYPIIAGF